MKKYLLIPIFFIAAFATSYAGCGACGDHGRDEEKASCCKSDCDSSKCDKEKCGEAACDKAKSEKEACCAGKKAE